MSPTVVWRFSARQQRRPPRITRRAAHHVAPSATHNFARIANHNRAESALIPLLGAERKPVSVAVQNDLCASLRILPDDELREHGLGMRLDKPL